MDAGVNSNATVTVFTNGCFDIFHAGHARLLQWARRLGDELIVGLNSDSSVRTKKGPKRPINCLADRRAVLEAMACVDKVIAFDESDAVRLVKLIRPDIYVKGPGCMWCFEMDYARSIGSMVYTPDWPVLLSTSVLSERIVDL